MNSIEIYNVAPDFGGCTFRLIDDDKDYSFPADNPQTGFTFPNGPQLDWIACSTKTTATPTATPTLDPACQQGDRQQLVISIKDQPTQQVFVELDDQKKYAQSTNFDLRCSYPDDPAFKDICHQCVDQMSGITIKNVAPNFGGCSFALIGKKGTYDIKPAAPTTGFTFVDGPQLDWISCKHA